MQLKQEVYFLLCAEMLQNNNKKLVQFKETIETQSPLSKHPVHVQLMIKTAQDFCTYITKLVQAPESAYINKKTYNITLQRYVLIRDIDNKNCFQKHEFVGDKFDFILSTDNKLIYPHDVRKTLNVPFYFEQIHPNTLNSKRPVYIEKYDKHNAHIRQLTTKDTVVDMNLNQIYPTETNTIPTGLIKLLSQGKEIVR